MQYSYFAGSDLYRLSEYAARPENRRCCVCKKLYDASEISKLAICFDCSKPVCNGMNTEDHAGRCEECSQAYCLKCIDKNNPGMKGPNKRCASCVLSEGESENE